MNNIMQRQQMLVDAGYNLGNTGPNQDGVDGNWGKLSKQAWNRSGFENQHQKPTGSSHMSRIGGGLQQFGGNIGGLIGTGFQNMINAGTNIQGNVDANVRKANTITSTDGSKSRVLNPGEGGYMKPTNFQNLKKHTGGLMKGVGNVGMGTGSLFGSAINRDLGGMGQGAMQVGKGILGGGMSALGGLGSGIGMLGQAFDGVSFNPRYGE